MTEKIMKILGGSYVKYNYKHICTQHWSSKYIANTNISEGRNRQYNNSRDFIFHFQQWIDQTKRKLSTALDLKCTLDQMVSTDISRTCL